MPARGHRGTTAGRITPGKRVVAIALSTADSPGPGPYKDRCPEHGIHTALEVEHPLTVDRWGDTWTLDEAFAISYCEDCFAEALPRHRQTEQKHDRSVDHLPRSAGEAEPEDIVEVLALRSWREVYPAFEPSDRDAMRERLTGEAV